MNPIFAGQNRGRMPPRVKSLPDAGEKRAREDDMLRSSDLFIESVETGEAGEAAAPIRFSDPERVWLEGFDAVRAAGDTGGYHSVLCGEIWLSPPEDRGRLSRALRALVSQYRRRMHRADDGAPILVAGLGTERMAADALGPRTAARILASTDEMRRAGMSAVCAVKTGIPRETGMDTASLVKALARETGASLIVTVDSLTARSRERLGTLVQITDCGVTPGSALAHSSGEISARTMPCPVLSLGVPTVIRSDVLAGETADDPMFVSRADTDAMVTAYARILAAAINGAFSGNAAGNGIIGAPDA